MSFDFPTSPSENQEFTPPGGVTYAFKSPKWTVKPVTITGSTDWSSITGKPATFPPTLPIAQTGVTNLISDLANKSALGHTHPQAEVTGLETALSGKEPIVTAGNTTQYWRGDKTWVTLPIADWTTLPNKPALFPPSAHVHTISDTTSLQTTLDGKAALIHTHNIADVSGLQTALNAKEALLPAGGNTTNYLRGDRTWQVISSGASDWGSITGKPSTFPPSTHTHLQSEVTNLTNDLGAKLALAGGTMTGKLTTIASTTGSAGFSIPAGGFVSAPADGDLWVNGADFYYRSGGATLLLATTNSAQTIGAAKTFSIKPIMATPGSATASLNLPHGSAPTSPVNGDMWTTTVGLYTRINGSTKGPYVDTVDLSAKANLSHTHAESDITNLTTDLTARVLKAGDTMTGNLAIYPPSGNAQFTLSKLSSGSQCFFEGRTNNSMRWKVTLGNSVAETGSDTGSDFSIDRYNDTGVYVDSPLVIARANGKALTAGDPINPLGIATKQYVDAKPEGRAATGDIPPATPYVGQIWFESNSGKTFLYYDDGDTTQWVQIAPGGGTAPPVFPTAGPRNRIVNGAMQISQENGNTAGTTVDRYGVDQFSTQFAGAVVQSTQRVQIITPNGSRDRYRVLITTADAALAAGDYLAVATSIEGIRITDFFWGTPTIARQVVLRFGFKAPAGTYYVALVNSAQTRSYVAKIVITAGQANLDTTQTFVIPGETSGVWNITSSGAGIRLWFVFACGTTFQAPSVGWHTGNYIAGTDISNGMATLGNSFEIFDVGLYLDPQFTGKAPVWELPNEAEELRACQRYLWVIAGAAGSRISTGMATTAATQSIYTLTSPVPMRGTPSLTHPTMSSVAGSTIVNITSFATPVITDTLIYLTSVQTGGPALGVVNQLRFVNAGNMIFNARI